MEITQQLILRTLLHPAGTRAMLRVILPATVLAGTPIIQVQRQARTDRVTQQAAIVATRRHLARPVADFRPVTLHHQATVHHRATVPRLATVPAHRATAHYAITLPLRQGTTRPTASTIIKSSEYYSSANKERHSNLPHTFCLNNGIDFGLYDSILCVRAPDSEKF